jgi:hypothetical protein
MLHHVRADKRADVLEHAPAAACRIRKGCLQAEPAQYRALLQRSRFSIAAFELEDHAFDVPVVLMRLQKLQTLPRIAPL